MALLCSIRGAHQPRVRLSINMCCAFPAHFLRLAPPQTTPDCRLIPLPSVPLDIKHKTNLHYKFIRNKRNGNTLGIVKCESRGYKYERTGTPYTCQFVNFRSTWVGNETCAFKVCKYPSIRFLPLLYLSSWVHAWLSMGRLISSVIDCTTRYNPTQIVSTLDKLLLCTQLRCQVSDEECFQNIQVWLIASSGQLFW